MTEAERVTGLLGLSEQARERYRQLETIWWRVNFSIWAFLGGVAYFITGRTPPNDRIGCPSLVLLVAVLLHYLMLNSLIKSLQGWRQWSFFYMAEARRLLEIQAIEGRPLPPQRTDDETRKSDNGWIWLSVLVSSLLAVAVIYLVF